MKRVLFFIAVIAFSLTLKAQPPAGAANPGDTYGDKITADGAISLADLSGKLTKSENVTAKIKGKVTEVCAKKGCWLTMEMPDKSKMQVKFKDYGFFVPANLSGKTIVLDGVARQKLVSVNELKHYAQDAKKPQAEIDAITKPEKQVTFTASGVLVM